MTEHQYAQMICDLGGPPRAGELDFAPCLDDWTAAVRLNWFCMFGLISGHPKIDDGQLIYTSPLVALDNNLTWARTRSRFYVLGPVVPREQVLAHKVRDQLERLKKTKG